jgi:hypothetical protein
METSESFNTLGRILDASGIFVEPCGVSSNPKSQDLSPPCRTKSRTEKFLPLHNPFSAVASARLLLTEWTIFSDFKAYWRSALQLTRAIREVSFDLRATF